MGEITFTGKPTGMGPKGAWVFLVLSKEVPQALGTKTRAPIVVTVAGKEFRVSAFPDGQGGHHINFNMAMQAASGWSKGESVKVSVVLDTRPRTVAGPKDLKAAPAKTPKAKPAFDRLSSPPSHAF